MDAVLEQLIIDGHADAVHALLAEAGVLVLPQTAGEAVGIRERTAARSAVLRRDVRAAQALLPRGVLVATGGGGSDGDSCRGAALALRLEQQAVVDQLATGTMALALDTARARLLAADAPWAAHAELRAEAERTMALFLYDTAAVAAGAVGDCPHDLAALLSAAHRQATADAVNAAMLTAGGHAMDARLEMLLREALGGASGIRAPTEAGLDVDALLTGGLRLRVPPTHAPRRQVVARRQPPPPPPPPPPAPT